MDRIELTLAEGGNKVSLNRNTVCYVVDENNTVKIQFIGTHLNFIMVSEKYEVVMGLLTK